MNALLLSLFMSVNYIPNEDILYPPIKVPEVCVIPLNLNLILPGLNIPAMPINLQILNPLKIPPLPNFLNIK